MNIYVGHTRIEGTDQELQERYSLYPAAPLEVFFLLLL
jgi:hypothetical protein